MASRRKVLPGLTRRQWGGWLAVTPLAAHAALQVPAPASLQVPAPAGSATTPAKAETDVANVKQRLAAIDVPMGVEPSFRFIP